MSREFWPKSHNLRFHWGNPKMPIYTRDYGDIPGITEAPREGIYRPMPEDVARNECYMRALRYERDVTAYINEELPKEELFREFNRPMWGAYGEKL